MCVCVCRCETILRILRIRILNILIRLSSNTWPYKFVESFVSSERLKTRSKERFNRCTFSGDPKSFNDVH